MPSDAPEMKWKITRSFARFAMEIEVSVMLSERASIPVSGGKTRDISLGGLGAFLEPPVAVGQKVWLEFRLPHAAEAIRVLSKVRHDYGERFGFQFLNISAEQQDQIRQACQGLTHV